MKITTNKGKTFDAVFAHAPLMNGTCMVEIHDTRHLADIADDFDGLTTITKESEAEGNAVYEGYDTLISLIRDSGSGTVRLTLRRSEEG